MRSFSSQNSTVGRYYNVCLSDENPRLAGVSVPVQCPTARTQLCWDCIQVLWLHTQGSVARSQWHGYCPHVEGVPGLQAGCPVWEYPLWMTSCLLAGLLHPAGMTTWGAVIVGRLCLLTPCPSLEAAAMHVGVSLAYLCLRRQSWLPPQPLSLCELAVL